MVLGTWGITGAMATTGKTSGSKPAVCQHILPTDKKMCLAHFPNFIRVILFLLDKGVVNPLSHNITIYYSVKLLGWK